MSNHALTPVPHGDGFEGYEDQIEGGDRRQGGVIRGSVVKFTNETTWVTRDGEELPHDLELVAVDIGRVVQKWVDQQPVETRILEPGEKFPDLKELNDNTPRSEWGVDLNGNPRGPWQAQHIVYLLNPATMDRYSFPTGTTGGAICVRELVDKTNWMRRFRGAHVYPVVALSDRFMNTKFGGRQRPHFLIKRWVDLDGGEEVALPAPEPAPKPAAAALENKPAEAPKNPAAADDDDRSPAAARERLARSKTTRRGVTRFSGGRRGATVEPVSPGEEMDDEIPF
jgi:hypothetical protein